MPLAVPAVFGFNLGMLSQPPACFAGVVRSAGRGA
jgi:hypothetical protein